MTSLIEIVPSIALHARELALTLREKDKAEATALGLDPVKGTFYAYRHACYRMTALIDDEVAAMWGLHGELLGSVGYPYLITGTKVEKISPLNFARVYIKEVQVMRNLFPVLENFVDASYEGAIKMLKLAGFTLTGPYQIKDNMFYKFRMET